MPSCQSADAEFRAWGVVPITCLIVAWAMRAGSEPGREKKKKKSSCKFQWMNNQRMPMFR
jgi:hypothetical protein